MGSVRRTALASVVAVSMLGPSMAAAQEGQGQGQGRYQIFVAPPAHGEPHPDIILLDTRTGQSWEYEPSAFKEGPSWVAVHFAGRAVLPPPP